MNNKIFDKCINVLINFSNQRRSPKAVLRSDIQVFNSCGKIPQILGLGQISLKEK